MTSIRVHASPTAIVKDALAKMDAAVASFTFTDPKIRDAAQRFVEGYRSRSTIPSLGHPVGMEVHDVGGPPATREPGMMFTIEPAMTMPDEHIGIRLEDMILVTESGHENLSSSVPIDIADIERTMGRQ